MKNVPFSTRKSLFAAGDIRAFRKALGLNQSAFWTPIGVKQSGGSRYESGRDMPSQVGELVRLYWVEGINYGSLTRVNFLAADASLLTDGGAVTGMIGDEL